MPQVSIILPVYNVEKYLRQCLDSISNQTFKDFECICVNDGSTDNSLSILQEYANKDNRIKIISQENKGLSAARNIALKLAIGKYVTFIDSKDWVLNKYLETLYKIITLYDYDIVCAQHKIYYENINEFQELKNILKIKNLLLKDNRTIVDKINMVDLSRNVWNKMYKNTFLIKNNFSFFKDIFSAQDYSFNFICFCYTDKYIFLDNILYFYRKKRTESLINDDENIRVETSKAFMKTIEFLLRKDFNNKNFFRIFIKLLIYHLGKVSKNVSLKNKTITIDKAILLLDEIKNYLPYIKNYEIFCINIILFLLKTFQLKSLIIFRIFKNII